MGTAERLSQAERTDISDARMLDAAIQLLVEKGAANTTLKDVGERAGYSRGLAGYRFGNKSGLFKFVVRSVGEVWLNELKEVTRGLVGYDAIAAAVDAHYRSFDEAPANVAAFYLLWFESVGPEAELKDVISGIHTRRSQDVVEWIEQAQQKAEIVGEVGAHDVAEQFNVTIIGIVYQWLLNPADMESIKKHHEGLKRSMRFWLRLEK